MSALAEEPRLQASAEQPAAAPRVRPVRVRRLSTSGLIWTGVLTVLLAGLVALNVAALRKTIEIGKVNGTVRQLQQENRQLQAHIATLSSSPRITRMARRYGMHQSPTLARDYLSLSTGQSHAPASGSGPAQ